MKARARFLGYVAVAAIASAAVILVTPDIKSGVPTVVQALATIALTAVAAEALIANRELVRVTQDQAAATRDEAEATRDEAAASREQAKAALDAVEAATAGTLEQRRLAILASVPYVSMDQPVASEDPSGNFRLWVGVNNQGPGPALHVQVYPEVGYYTTPGQFVRMQHTGWPEALVVEGHGHAFFIPAQDIRTIRTVRYNPADVPTVRPDIVPDFIRIRLTWLSLLGARVEQVFVWSVRTPKEGDAPAWQFDRMTLDPGAGNGEPVTFAKPPFP